MSTGKIKILRNGNLSRWLKSSKDPGTPTAFVLAQKTNSTLLTPMYTLSTRVLRGMTAHPNNIMKVPPFSGRISKYSVLNIVRRWRTVTILPYTIEIALLVMVTILREYRQWKIRERRLRPIWFRLMYYLHQRRLRVSHPDKRDKWIKRNPNCSRSTFLWERHLLNSRLELGMAKMKTFTQF